MQKWSNAIFWLTGIVVVSFLFAFVGKEKKVITCENISIDIEAYHDNYFLNDKLVKEILIEEFDSLIGLPVDSINIQEMEKLLVNHGVVKSANIFKTQKGDLDISVSVKKPVLRIKPNEGAGFYLDENGEIMPWSEHYTSRVPLVMGSVMANNSEGESIDVNEHSFKKLRKSKMLEKLFNIALLINKNEFWNAQIDYMYISSSGEMTIYPKMGDHTILIGDLDGFELKLKKVKTVYDKVLIKVGWDVYKQINVKYHDQVVCTKK